MTHHRILLGKIGAAHGIKGHVKVTFYGENPSILETAPLYASENGDTFLRLALKNGPGALILAAVEGVTDRTQAEKLNHTQLWIDRAALPEPDADEIYHADLIGLNVFDLKGQIMGSIVAIDNFGAGDLLEIRPLSGESFYLPFTEENVPQIDLEAGRLVIDPPDGLLE